MQVTYFVVWRCPQMFTHYTPFGDLEIAKTHFKNQVEGTPLRITRMLHEESEVVFRGEHDGCK